MMRGPISITFDQIEIYAEDNGDGILFWTAFMYSKPDANGGRWVKRRHDASTPSEALNGLLNSYADDGPVLTS